MTTIDMGALVAAVKRGDTIQARWAAHKAEEAEICRLVISNLRAVSAEALALAAKLSEELQRVARDPAPGGLSSRGPALPAAKETKGKGGRPKGYKTSAATRAKLRAAWKRRKANKK